MSSKRSIPHLFAVLLAAALILAQTISALAAPNRATDTSPDFQTSVTIYGDLADGEVLNISCKSDWNICRNAPISSSRWAGLSSATVGASYDASNGYTINRTFLFFDTSAIPVNVQITGVTLNLYTGYWQNGTKTIHVARSMANIPLTTADFGKVDFVSGGSVTPASPESWMSIDLASTAFSWIIPGSMTKLAIIHDLDLNNIAPNVRNDILVGLAEDQLYRPYLTVNYIEKPITTLVLNSIATSDGWILESSELSKKGGTLDAKATTLRLGDDAANKQYLGILSFNTGAELPDEAVILKATLKLKKQKIIGGGDPLKTFQGFMVDIKNGAFGTSALQAGDFQAKASKAFGPFKPTPSSGWYSLDLTTAKGYLNKLSTASGQTQIRLRFKLDDNNNAIANYLSLYSGNAPAASKPQLVIEYFIP